VAVASAGPYASLTSLQTDNHASTPPLSFLQAGCPSCRQTNSIKALKAVYVGPWQKFQISILGVGEMKMALAQ